METGHFFFTLRRNHPFLISMLDFQFALKNPYISFQNDPEK
jgi:hypothetical protein